MVQVRSAFWHDRELAPFNLTVMVKHGTATLSGSVPSDYFRQRALRVARQVAGINAVVSELRLRTVTLETRPGPRQFPAVDQPVARSLSLGTVLRPKLGMPQPGRRHADSTLASRPNDPIPVVADPTPAWRPAARTPWHQEKGAEPRPTLQKPILPPGGEEGAKNPSPPTQPSRELRPATLGRPKAVLDLAYSLERFFRSNPRFATIKFEIDGRRVRLSGTVPTAAELADLVRAVSALPGVVAVQADEVTLDAASDREK